MLEQVPSETTYLNDNMVTFKQLFTLPNDLQNEEWLQNLMDDNQWDIGIEFEMIGVSRFEGLQNLDILSNIQSLNIKSLKIRWALKANILTSIRTISFPLLKQIYLNGNSIRTIEPLSMIYLPNLEKLNLKQNLLVKIDSLRKCNIPNLREISLYFNAIQQCRKFSELNCPAIKIIWLNGQKQQCQSNYLSWAAKIQTRKLNKFLVKCQERIECHRKSVWEKLEEKMETQKRIQFGYQMKDDHGISWL